MNIECATKDPWEGIAYPTLAFESSPQSTHHEGVKIRVECLAGRNWSLRGLYSQEALDERPEFAEELSWALAERGIMRAYAPGADMSGMIVDRETLSTQIRLPYGNDLFRNRLVPSEGVPLMPGDALIVSLGGCGLGIATGDGACIAAHIGRESAIDRAYLTRSSSQKRDPESAVEAMARYARKLCTIAGHMRFRYFFPLPQGAFGHPLYGHPHEKYNLAMAEYVQARYGMGIVHVRDGIAYLDMHALVMAQAAADGFMLASDGKGSVLPHFGEFGHTGHPAEPMKLQRNLAIVHRIA